MEMAQKNNFEQLAREMGLIEERPWERDDFAPTCAWPRRQRPSIAGPMTLGYRDQRQWVGLVVAPQRERKVAEFLRDARRPVYFPNWTRIIRGRGGMRRSVIMAVMPGYLFLAKGVKDDLQPLIEMVPGLMGYLHDGQLNPLLLSEIEIQGIRLIEADMNKPEPDRKSANEYKIGDEVKTVEALHLGWKGKIVELASDQRIGLEVKLLGRTVKVYVSSAQIEPCVSKGSQNAATPGQAGRRR